MNNLNAILDFGSRNLILGIFDQNKKNIYYSAQQVIHSENKINLEKLLNIQIRDAEKNLSTHIDKVIVLYDSPKFYSLDFSIKKVFDHSTSIKKVYNSSIDEANFLVSQNNFKDQIIHLVVNNIIIDENKKLDSVIKDIKIKSLLLEIKFICLNKKEINDISNIFRKNNLEILNLYCSSYVKTYLYKKKFQSQDNLIFLDIGHKRSSSLIFNNKRFEYFKSIAVGGYNITKDISKVLKLELDYSEDLKIKFNKLEKEVFYKYSEDKKINPYSEVIEKNISSNLLKKVIEARLDEIIDLVLIQSNYIKNFNFLDKLKLIIMGGGSKLIWNSYNLSIKESFSKLEIIGEDTLNPCEAGLEYHNCDETLYIKAKKKLKKRGFFENFFNLFSK